VLFRSLLLLIVALLLFGPNKLPDMARSLGNALNEFKKALNPPAENQNPQSQNPNQSAMSTAAPVARRARPARRSRSKR
jgi:sec-independent protein translocase protein TatA